LQQIVALVAYFIGFIDNEGVLKAGKHFVHGLFAPHRRVDFEVAGCEIAFDPGGLRIGRAYKEDTAFDHQSPNITKRSQRVIKVLKAVYYTHAMKPAARNTLPHFGAHVPCVWVPFKIPDRHLDPELPAELPCLGNAVYSVTNQRRTAFRGDFLQAMSEERV